MQVLSCRDLPLLIEFWHHCFKTVLLFTYNLYLSVSCTQVLANEETTLSSESTVEFHVPLYECCRASVI